VILPAFRVRSFRFQWSADLLTSWAFEMETVVLGWYVVTHTGSVMLLTIFGSLQYVGTLAAPMFGVLGDRFRPPAWQSTGTLDHLLGTDHLGRDVLSRLIFGARISVIVGLTVVIVAGVIGTALGIISGYLGRWVDQGIMRLTDAWLALPGVTFAIFLAAILGPSVSNIIIILAAVYWTRYARIVRGEVLSVRERDFVRLAVVAGCSKWAIMRRHILPNVMNTFMVLLTLHVGVVVLAEASLSFLGAGIPPPTPSWGQMVAEGRGKIASAWWLSLLPGLAITLVVLAFNLFGDWLRDRLDPKLRQL
jgi:peptide/nickel transport system permease protein